ncbi:MULTISPECIES: hemerythrin domain-containing protein [unclassified Streptomyces]|uniref:hemerythrin domain-containing protein n=1 Tax=unclassified Streptomyces TaxID=2593676 RepID=UPI00333494EC
MNTKPNTRTADEERPDTREMVIIHRGLRREARLLVELIAAVPPGDTARATVLAGHFRDYRLGLHNHHHGEDLHLWPALLAKVDLEADAVLRMDTQHERIAQTLTAAEATLPAWESTGGEQERDALVAALSEHRAVLVEHLDEEERVLLPLVARHLTQREWKAMGDHFLESTPKPKLLLFLGIVLEDADQAERAAVLAGLPLPARLVWHAVGRPLYRRRTRLVRGSRA